ncbi:type II secretion system protein GspM, partial [Paracidovorax avenae]|uniref:type II secretion system protein GspM n=1 Tax=Paracidovorax avenae TaxID=80867 RepID=UPI001CEF6D22
MKPARSPSPSAASASRAEALRARWKTLAPREQSLVLAAGTVVAVALLWWVALAPALRTLREAPAQHAALDAQLQRMQALQSEALQLQAAPAAPARCVSSWPGRTVKRMRLWSSVTAGF